MKKLILLLAFLLLLPGCGRGKEAPAETPAFDLSVLYKPMADVDKQVAGVTMTVLHFDEELLRIRIKNEHEACRSISYGPKAFWLEYAWEGKWYALPYDNNLGWTDEAFIQKRGARELDIDYLTHYAPLPPGHYRVVKEVGCDCRSYGSAACMTAEFTVE